MIKCVVTQAQSVDYCLSPSVQYSQINLLLLLWQINRKWYQLLFIYLFMLSSLLLDHAVYDDSWLDHLNEKKFTFFGY